LDRKSHRLVYFGLWILNAWLSWSLMNWKSWQQPTRAPATAGGLMAITKVCHVTTLDEGTITTVFPFSQAFMKISNFPPRYYFLFVFYFGGFLHLFWESVDKISFFILFLGVRYFWEGCYLFSQTAFAKMLKYGYRYGVSSRRRIVSSSPYHSNIFYIYLPKLNSFDEFFRYILRWST